MRETVRLPEVIAETTGLFNVSARHSRVEVSILNKLPDHDSKVGEGTTVVLRMPAIVPEN